MKFKLNDRFLSQIKQYLTEKEIYYTWTEDQSTGQGTLTVQDSSDSTLKLKHAMAQKLLNQYQKQKIARPQLNIGDWMENYAKMFSNIKEKQLDCTSLNNHLMIIKYNLLKQSIANKKISLAQVVLSSQGLKEKYMKQSEVQQTKIKLSLQNISYRLKLKQNDQKQSNEELDRIKNLLKNGLWGTLAQLQAKLKQVEQLQGQIQQLKKSNLSPSN